MIESGVTFFLVGISFYFVHCEIDIIPSPGPEFVKEQCAALANEEYAVDPRRCRNTCQYYGRTWDCPIDYKPNGDCFCKAGFARLTEGGACVSIDDLECSAKLPIQPESCNGPFEMYSERVDLGVCDVNCRTFGCLAEIERHETGYKWNPRCICGNNEERFISSGGSAYRRVSNGTCVPADAAECVAEYQPSPERCAALGRIYAVDAPCQQACYGEEYCPPAGPTCICPESKLAYSSYEGYDRPYTDVHCYSKENCPEAKFAPAK